MPTYQVEDERGRVLELEGDHPPSDDELRSIFHDTFKDRTVSQATTVREPQFSQPLAGMGGAPQMVVPHAQLAQEPDATEPVPLEVRGMMPSQAARLNEAMAQPKEQSTQAKLETPLVNLPEETYAGPIVSMLSPENAVTFGRMAKRVIEGQTSPAGLAALPYAALGGAEGMALKGAGMAGKAIAGAFGVQGLEELPGAVGRYVRAVASGNKQEAAEAWGDMATSSMMIAGAAHVLPGAAKAFTDVLQRPGEIFEGAAGPERQLMAPRRFMPEFQEGPIGPEPREVAPESRQLPAPRTRMPEFTESTLEPGGPPTRALPAPGESGATGGLLPESPETPRTAGYRIQLPVEPEAAKAARERWSRPIDVEAEVTPASEGAQALRKIISISDELNRPGQPYQPPVINVDLRQLEAQMKRNTVSKVEGWADQVIKDKLGGTSANPFADPEFLAAVAAKGAILFKRGVTKAAEWNASMREQFGRGVEDYLPKIYQQSKDYWEARANGDVPPPIAKGESNAIGQQSAAAPVRDVLRSGQSGAPKGGVPEDVSSETTRVRSDQSQGTPGTSDQETTQARVGQTTSSTPTPESEVNLPGGTGEAPPVITDIFGISDKARQRMAEQGEVPYVPPGEGTTMWESIQHGRQLLRDGRNPQEAIDNFTRTHRFGYDDISILRAKMEQLYKQAQKVKEKMGADSPEYLAAKQKLVALSDATKEMSTEWHRIGMGQQGMTDVDTGDVLSMEKAHRDAKGHDFTEEQRGEAEEIAGEVRKARKERAQAEEETINKIDQMVKKKAPGVKPAKTLAEARAQFAEGAAEGGTPDKMTPKQVRALWDRARNEYIAKGVANIDDIASGLAKDFGVTREQVKRALTQPKGTKPLTDELYLKQARARQLEAAARAWLAEADLPKALRAFKSIPDLLFSAKTLGHGTVGMITHAGAIAFDPRTWNIYSRNFLEQFKLAYKGILDADTRGVYHESRMQDLIRDPNWLVAKRAGLANDPFKFYDDYQKQQMHTALGSLVKAGNRGFDVLKILRQDLFNREWERISPAERTKEMSQALAELINHATGVVTGNVFGSIEGAANTFMFAPRLEASRWAWLFKDSAKTLATVAKAAAGGEVSPVEKMAAMSDAARKGAIFGTFMSMLALNQAMLSLFGVEQEVNFTEPNRGDFLAFKGFGHEVGVIGPLLRLVGFLTDEVKIAATGFGVGQRSKLERTESVGKEMAGRAWQYARGKASPFGGIVADVATSENWRGQPMPWSEAKLRASVRRQGLEAETWPHYLTTQGVSIPIEEMLKHVWEGQGIDEATATQWLNGLLSLSVTGFTGVRVPEDKRAGE